MSQTNKKHLIMPKKPEPEISSLQKRVNFSLSIINFSLQTKVISIPLGHREIVGGGTMGSDVTLNFVGVFVIV